jgi:hypothetical protein
MLAAIHAKRISHQTANKHKKGTVGPKLRLVNSLTIKTNLLTLVLPTLTKHNTC